MISKNTSFWGYRRENDRVGIRNHLRRFKDDVKEVKEGYECGIGIENFNDLKVGDLIELYRTESVARTLQPAQAS